MSKLRKKFPDNKVNILLTRPEKDSIKLSKSLDENSFSFFISPLIKIEKKEYSYTSKRKFDFVIFTSKNGILNFEESIGNDVKVIVIGDGTYNLAKEKGIKKLINIQGNSEDLKIKIKSLLEKNSKILHPTSTDLNVDFKDFFVSLGCSYNPVSCYHSKKLNSKPEIFENFFKSCKDGVITLFSKRTAISLKNEISRFKLWENCVDKRVLVLSKSIANEIREIRIGGLFISEQPNEASMLELINKTKKKEY